MKQLTKKQMQDFVTIICYGQPEIMRRDDAIDKYYEGMMCCEGSERDRYCNIYFQLMEGKKVCVDL